MEFVQGYFMQLWHTVGGCSMNKPQTRTGLVGPIRHGPDYMARIEARAKVLRDASKPPAGARQLRLPLRGLIKNNIGSEKE